MTAVSDAASDGKGVFFMVLSEALLCVVNVIIKYVKAWPTERIMVVRYTSDFLLCIVLCCAWRVPAPSPKIAARLVLRGISYICFVCCLWAGLRSCLPLGDVVVGIVATSPLFLVLLTRVFLGEKIPSMWPLQMALCLTGALLVNKPLAPPPGCTVAATLLPFAAGFFGALMNFASRNVKEVSPPVVMAFNDLVAVIFASAYIAMQSGSDNFETMLLPNGFDKSFVFVVIAAAIGWVGLMTNVKGYQSVSVAAIAGIAGYVSVPFGYVSQIVVFNEIPDILSTVGASLILATNVSVAVSKYFAAAETAKDQHKEYEKPFLKAEDEVTGA